MLCSPLRALSPVWDSAPEGEQLQLSIVLYHPGREEGEPKEGVDGAEDTTIGHKGMNFLYLVLLSDGERTQQGSSTALLYFPSAPEATTSSSSC